MIIIEIPTQSDLYVTLPNGGDRYVGTLVRAGKGYHVERLTPPYHHDEFDDEFLMPDGAWSPKHHEYATKDEAKEAVERYWNTTGQYLFKP